MISLFKEKGGLPEAYSYEAPPPMVSPEDVSVREFTWDFLANTSAHGLPRIAASQGKVRKVGQDSLQTQCIGELKPEL